MKNKILRYLAEGIIIYLLLKYLLTRQIEMSTLLIVVLIILVTFFVLFENINISINFTEGFDVPQATPFKDDYIKRIGGGYEIKLEENKQVEKSGSRTENDVLADESKYVDLNNLPVEGINSGSFEYGYSFLPPEKWYPVPPHPPVCVSEKKCEVCPTYTEGTDIMLKEWNDSRRIMPPDQINTEYVKGKLNSGR